MKKSLFCFIFFANAICAFSQFTQQTIQELSSFREINDLSVGDIDNDKDDDILILGKNSSSHAGVHLLINAEDSFSSIELNIGDFPSGGIDLGDYDNDGDLDILVTGKDMDLWFDEYRIKIYANDGTGSFTNTFDIGKGFSQSKCKWGDYDQDGDLDFVVGGEDDNGLETNIYRNDGNNQFTNINAGLLGLKLISNMRWIDLDNDDDLDIIYNGYNASYSEYTKAYINDGDDSFSELSHSFSGASPYPFDFNNDGQMDILVGSSTYENNGDGTFTTNIGAIPIYMQESIYIDYNNDGNQDLVSSGLHYFYVYSNDGAGNFSQVQDLGTTFRGGKFYRIDYNGDSKSDFVFVGTNDSYQTEIYIYENTTSTTNTAPSAPTNLSVTLSGSSAEIIWDQSSDSQTATTALSYNVMIGTSSNDIDILSPASDISDGDRLLLYYGNASTKKSYTINNLEPGNTYYVKVQAIDNSFLASTFSTEETFNVPIFDEDLSPIFTTDYGKSHTKWIDYDNDNDLDFFLSGINDHQGGLTGNINTILYRNDGGYSFTEIDEQMKPLYQSNSEWIDYDNDGDLDVLFYGKSNPNNSAPEPMTIIYRNDGNDVFTDIQAGIESTYPPFGNAIWNDINHDGLYDVLVVSTSQILVYFNKGNDVFVEKYQEFLGLNITSCIWMDYNNDNEMDLITFLDTDYLSAGDETVNIYENDGNINFTKIQSTNDIPGIEGSRTYPSIADYNSDGFLDIAIVNQSHNGSDWEQNLILLKNNGNATFSEVLELEDTSNYGYPVWGDYDNDGDLDIAAPKHIFENKGNDVFEAIGTPLPDETTTLSWGDFDNDNDLDLFITNLTEYLGVNFCHVFRNNVLPNNPPSAPTDLNHEFIDGTSKVILSWNRALDTEQNNGKEKSISYNVRIGTAPGKEDILSSNANLQTGYRKVVDYGNALLDTFMVIQDLPEGTFYWSVQAIDNTFMGSGFAIEDSFAVGLFSDDPQTLTFCTGDTIEVPFHLNGLEVGWDNQFVLQLSDPYGYFDVPAIIGDWQSTTSGTIQAVIPNDTKEGFKYKIRILTTFPRIIGHENDSYITINPTPTPSISGVPFVCENEVGQVYSTYNYPNDDYLWVVDGGNITSANDNAQILVKWNSAGAGKVTLTQTNALGCYKTQSLDIIINPLPSPVLGADKRSCMGTDVSLDAGTGFNTYLWNNGQSQSSIAIEETGDYYVNVTDNNGCKGTSDTVNVYIAQPFVEEICIVTVDDETGKNLISWEKTPDQGIASYNVYRESVTAEYYDKIGTLSFDETSIFIDSASVPETRSYKYYLTTIDTCGNESEPGQYHKTMLLTSSMGMQGVNLYWSEYVIGGAKFGFESYVIYRGTDPSSLDSIDQIPSDNEIYPDLSAPSGTVYYKIAGIKPGVPCDPADLLKANSGPFSRSISNLEDNRQRTTFMDEAIEGGQLLVYPNPMTSSTTIITNRQQSYSLKVYDLTGKLMLEKKNIQGPNIILERGNLNAGIYLIELSGKQTFREKLIIK